MRPFKLHRVCVDQMNLSNVASFSWSWILKEFFLVQHEVQ